MTLILPRGYMMSNSRLYFLYSDTGIDRKSPPVAHGYT